MKAIVYVLGLWFLVTVVVSFVGWVRKQREFWKEPETWVLERKGDVQGLIAMLRRGEERKDAARALVAIGDPAVQPLVDALDDPDSDVGIAAVSALGEIGHRQAVGALVALLEDGSTAMRIAAIGALGRSRDARALEPLIAILNDEPPELRHAAAKALGQLGDTRAVEPLLAALRDSHSPVCEAAANALVNIGGIQVAEPLMSLSREETGNLQKLAAEAFKKLAQNPDAPKAIQRLRQEEEEREHAEVVARVLKIHGLPESTKTLVGKWVRGEAGRCEDCGSIIPLSRAGVGRPMTDMDLLNPPYYYCPHCKDPHGESGRLERSDGIFIRPN